MKELIVLPKEGGFKRGFFVYRVIPFKGSWDLGDQVFVGESYEDCEAFVKRIERRAK